MELTHYFLSYNGERTHQSLDYKTPDVMYRAATGGGVKIVAKFGGVRGESLVPHYCTGDSSRAKLGQRHSAVMTRVLSQTW